MRRTTTILGQSTESSNSANALTAVESSDVSKRLSSVSTLGSEDLTDKTKHSSTATKNSSNNNIDSDDYKTTPFYIANALLFYCLSVCGLYHVRRENQSVSALQVYCWIMTILPFASLTVELSAMRLVNSVNIDLIQLLNITFFNVLCCNNAVAFLFHCHRPKAIRKLFIGIQKLDRFGGAYTPPARVQKSVKIVVLCACIFYLCGAALIAYTCIQMTVIDTFVKSLGFSPSNMVVKWLVTLFSCFIALLWYMPNCAALSFSLMIFFEYSLFHKAFVKKIDKDSGIFGGSLEGERKRFVAMSRIVESADRLLALHHGVSFITDTANLCLSLYCIAYFNTDPEFVAFLVWFLLTLVDLSNKILCGILVNYGVNLDCF